MTGSSVRHEASILLSNLFLDAIERYSDDTVFRLSLAVFLQNLLINFHVGGSAVAVGVEDRLNVQLFLG